MRSIDNYNAGMVNDVNGDRRDVPDGGRFVVHGIQSAGRNVITSGVVVHANAGRERRSSALTLFWEFDATGVVTGISVLGGDRSLLPSF